jgi:hypothetical protein
MPATVFRSPVPGDETALARLCEELGYPSTAAEVAARLARFAHLFVKRLEETPP